MAFLKAPFNKNGAAFAEITLYELRGSLPRDDVEKIRRLHRRAVV